MHLGEDGLGELTLELQLEALALADVEDTVEAQARQGAEHGLALRVEDLGLGHDVDDDSGHERLLGAGWAGECASSLGCGLPSG